jgi:3-oxoacyl-[acyl-carrier-protein] synthase-3
VTRAKISGVGCYLPERVVTNEEICTKLGTTAEWIVDTMGIRERRFARDDEPPAEMAEHATREALADAGIGIEDIDYLIASTENPDYFFPGAGCFLQERFQLGTEIGALDIRQQACGFVYALAVADQFIRAGIYSRILIASPELGSCGIEWAERGRDVSCMIGDGAGAVVVTAGEGDDGVLATDLHADGRHAHDYWVEADDNSHYPRITHEMVDQGLMFARLKPDVFYAQAVDRQVESVRRILSANGLSASDVDFFVPQQGNRRVNEAVASQLGIPHDKVDHSIERYGNTSSASIPIALKEGVRDGRIKRGDLLLLSAFGAGFTWGSALLRY